jgi:hypothetical protein
MVKVMTYKQRRGQQQTAALQCMHTTLDAAVCGTAHAHARGAACLQRGQGCDSRAYICQTFVSCCESMFVIISLFVRSHSP